MNAISVAFIGHVIYQFPELVPVLQEHLDDNNGELLPHLLMADITRWLVAAVEDSDKTFLIKAILAELERVYAERDEDDKISELIAVSCLENLPRPGENGAAIRCMLGPNLGKQLERIG